MGAPTWQDLKTAYFGDDTDWSDDQLEQAFAAEKRAQARVCRVPTDDATAWDEDLVEALGRRMAHNLALRGLPLGVQAITTDVGGAGGIRVGGTDAEVRRLEAPFRKVVVG